MSSQREPQTSRLPGNVEQWNQHTKGTLHLCRYKKIYLCTPLDRYEYMRMPINLIPQEFIDLYNLAPKVKNRFVYMEIRRGMHGLPQSGILANKLLKERLAKDSYFELPHTPGLFKHETRPVWFTLTVDDFGIKHIGKEHALHLISTLKKHYKIKVD